MFQSNSAGRRRRQDSADLRRYILTANYHRSLNYGATETNNYHEDFNSLPSSRRHSLNESQLDLSLILEQRNQLLQSSPRDISRFVVFICSAIVLLGLFANFLFASIFDNVYPALAAGISLSEFRQRKDFFQYPQDLFDILRLNEQQNVVMNYKLMTASDVLAVRVVCEVVANFGAGYIVYQQGHNFPITSGLIGGIFATISVLFASRSRVLLLVTAAIHGLSSGALVVGGMSLLIKFFDMPQARQRATTILHMLFCIAYSVAPIAVFEMESLEPFTILATIAAMLLLSVGLFNFFFPKSHPPHGKLIPLSSYCNRAYINGQVWVTVLCGFVVSFALSILMAKSTSFLRKLPADDDTNNHVAMVVYGGFFVQLLFQLICGVICVRLLSRPGLSLVIALWTAALVFMIYPTVIHGEFWIVVVVQFVGRACLGVSTIVIVPVLAKFVYKQIWRLDGPQAIPNNHGVIVGSYLAISHLAFAIGPVSFYLISLLKGETFAYNIIGILLLVASPLAVGIIGRCRCCGKQIGEQRVAFVTTPDEIVESITVDENLESADSVEPLLSASTPINIPGPSALNEAFDDELQSLYRRNSLSIGVY